MLISPPMFVAVITFQIQKGPLQKSKGPVGMERAGHAPGWNEMRPQVNYGTQWGDVDLHIS
jgi:hypothetical protein